VSNDLGGGPGIPEPAMPDRGPSQVNPSDLIPSHKVNQSPREMAALRESIRSKGFLHNADQPVAYVVVDGRKHLVDGHHRVRAARELGIGEIPAREVPLPYQGYRAEADLFDWER
jgi:ParB-like chromosome segregation protein Spo0J